MRLSRMQSGYQKDQLSKAFMKVKPGPNSVIILSISGIFSLSFGFFNHIYLIIIFSSMLILSALWIKIEPQMKVESVTEYILGEQTIINALKSLDDQYILINNIKLRGLTSKLNDVQLKNLNGNIDHTIFGPNGIFVIKTLSYEGKITCDGDEWCRSFMRWNLPIKDSPSRQIRRNSAILKNYLVNNLDFIKNKNNSFINSVIVLTRPSVDLEAKNATLTVLRAEELVNHINNSKKIYFSAEELKIIAQSIMSSNNQ